MAGPRHWPDYLSAHRDGWVWRTICACFDPVGGRVATPTAPSTPTAPARLLLLWLLFGLPQHNRLLILALNFFLPPGEMEDSALMIQRLYRQKKCHSVPKFWEAKSFFLDKPPAVMHAEHDRIGWAVIRRRSVMLREVSVSSKSRSEWQQTLVSALSTSTIKSTPTIDDSAWVGAHAVTRFLILT